MLRIMYCFLSKISVYSIKKPTTKKFLLLYRSSHCCLFSYHQFSFVFLFRFSIRIICIVSFIPSLSNIVEQQTKKWNRKKKWKRNNSRFQSIRSIFLSQKCFHFSHSFSRSYRSNSSSSSVLVIFIVIAAFVNIIYFPHC